MVTLDSSVTWSGIDNQIARESFAFWECRRLECSPGTNKNRWEQITALKPILAASIKFPSCASDASDRSKYGCNSDLDNRDENARSANCRTTFRRSSTRFETIEICDAGSCLSSETMTSNLPIDASERPSMLNDCVATNLIKGASVATGNGIGCSLASRISRSPLTIGFPQFFPSSQGLARLT